MSLTDAFFDLGGPPRTGNNNGLGQPDSARSLGQAAQYILGVDFPSAGPQLWSPRFGLVGTPGAGFGSSASADILNALGMVDNMTPRLLTGTHEPFPHSFSSEQHQTQPQQQQQSKEEEQSQQQLLPLHMLPQPTQLPAQLPLNLPPLNLPPLSFQINTGASTGPLTLTTTSTIKAEPRLSGSSGPVPQQLQQQLLLQRQGSDLQQQQSTELPHSLQQQQQQQQQQQSVDEQDQLQQEEDDDDSDSQEAVTGGRGGRRRRPAAKSGRSGAKGGVAKKGQVAAAAKSRTTAAAVVAVAAVAAVEVSPARVLYSGTVGSSGLMQTGEALPWSLSLQALNAQLAAASPGNTSWPAEADS